MNRSKIVCTLLLFVLIPFSSYAALKEVAKVVLSDGDVLVRNEKDATRKMKKLASGEKLFESDVINTSSNSKVKILFSDRSIFDLGPSTLFKIDEYKLNKGPDRKVQLSMDYGKIRAAVNEKLNNKGSFKVRTNGTTMGVRGTEFLVNSEISEMSEAPKQDGKTPQPQKGDTKVEIKVIEGKVEATVGEEKSGSSKNTQKLSIEKGQEAKINMSSNRLPANSAGDTKVEPAKVEMKSFDVQKDSMAVKQEIQINAGQAMVDSAVIGSALENINMNPTQHNFDPQELANTIPQGPPPQFIPPPEQSGTAKIFVQINP